jgi:penicillin-binding protein 1A
MVSRATKTKLQRGCLGLVSSIFILFFGALLLVTASVNAVLQKLSKDLPQASSLAYFEPSLTTKIYSSDGKLIATLFRENRSWVHLADMSPHVADGVLAIEDSRFYEHRGIDPIGVMRALLASRGGDRQGASTITMQLARNIFLNKDQKADRKLKEVVLAIRIEQTFTKAEIMEMYLNQIYLGSGCYGVQAAANVYFGKKIKDLSIAQSAMLAGLPQAPGEASPFNNLKRAKERTTEVLDRMLKTQKISDAQYRDALDELDKMKFNGQNREEFQVLEVPYFTTWVIKELHKKFDEDTLYRGGLQIYTTVDLDMQRQAEKVVKELITQDAEALNVHTGALVAIDNHNGYVKAMVGGLGWDKKNQFNRACQARRQPGSSFKPIIYATALESGLTPNSVMPDSPITVDGWSPKNSDGKYMGPISLGVALQNSRNVVSVRLAQFAGLGRIIDYAHQLGITEQLPEVLSLSLGAVEITPFEMAGAYTAFPNAGIKYNISGIKVVYDNDRRVVMDNRVPEAKEVWSEPTATGMVEMMKRVVEAGTATNAYIQNHEVAGKTGTTDSFKDAWFIGYTRDITTAVWVGNDDSTKMWSSFGGDLPARIWHDFMVFALRDKKESTIPRNRLTTQCCLYCKESDMRAGPFCHKVYRKLLHSYDLPYNYCTTHGAPNVTYHGVDKGKGDKGGATSDRSGTTDSAKPAGDAKTAAQNAANTAAPVPGEVKLPGEVPGGPGPSNPGPEPVNPGPEPAGPAPEPVPVPIEVPVEPPSSNPAPAPAPVPVQVPPPDLP